MDQTNRRNVLLFIIVIGIGLICLTVAFYRQIMSVTFRFFAPNIEERTETAVDAGSLSNYRAPGVYAHLKASNAIWIVSEPGGTLFALSTICTHLGCTPDWQADMNKFVCPCHGSEYDATGRNINGPTPRPLERLKIFDSDGRLYVDKGAVFREELGEWNHPHATLDLGGN